MKLQFIGSGSAFTFDNFQTNVLVIAPSGKKLLIDCGTDARFAMKQCGYTHRDVDAVFITHLHADHIGGMEWLAFCRYFDPGAGPHPKLFCVRNLMVELWENSLKGGLRSIEGKSMTLTDYFECHPVEPNGWFEWEGIRFVPVQTVHVEDGFSIVLSYGLFILQQPTLIPKEWSSSSWSLRDYLSSTARNCRKPCIFYTSDTQFCPNQLSVFYEMADYIFQDGETSPFRSKVHAHIDDLATLLGHIKSRMFLMHSQDKPKQDLKALGFAGFVRRGQVFDFTAKSMEDFTLQTTDSPDSATVPPPPPPPPPRKS